MSPEAQRIVQPKDTELEVDNSMDWGSEDPFAGLPLNVDISMLPNEPMNSQLVDGSQTTRESELSRTSRHVKDFLEDGKGSEKALGGHETMRETSNIRFRPESSNCSHSDSFVLFSCFRGIEADNMWRLEPHVASFLEQRGCFHVPSRAILYEFVRQYFLRVHPILPLLNEVEYQNLYCQQGSVPSREWSVPLFLVQALLFIACPVRLTPICWSKTYLRIYKVRASRKASPSWVPDGT